MHSHSYAGSLKRKSVLTIESIPSVLDLNCENGKFGFF